MHVQDTLTKLIQDTYQNARTDKIDTKPYWIIKGTCEVNICIQGKDLLDHIEHFREKLSGGTWQVQQYTGMYDAVWNKEDVLLINQESPNWAHIEVFSS